MKETEFEEKSKLLNFLEKWLMILMWIVVLIMVGFLVFDNIKKAPPQESDLKPADNKIPFSFQDDSMFYIDVTELDVAELNMGDVPLLESEGFVKKETENGNNINFIWELHE